jgi:hypothetical protein
MRGAVTFLKGSEAGMGGSEEEAGGLGSSGSPS